MILTILAILGILYVVLFFGLMTGAVIYYSRPVVTARRDGWDNLAEDDYDRVTGLGPW